MIAVRHACAVLLAMLPGIGQPGPAMAQGEGAALSPSGAAGMRTERIDRTVVSPFRGDRRIVVRPGRDGGSEVVAVGAAPATASGIAGPAPVPTGAFVDIGPLDAPPAPLSPPVPSPRGEYLDTGPYDGGALAFPAPPSPFSPD